MPAPSSSTTMVVQCEGCSRNVPAATEAVKGTVVVVCPVCLERRAYIVATEVFLGRPSWEVMRKLRGRR